MAWDVGDTVPLTTEIRDDTGELVDATGVELMIGLPDGTADHPPVIHRSTGVYAVDFVPTMPGRHTERWSSTAPATARSDMFDVRPLDPPYVVSLADAKATLNMPASSTVDDEELRTWLEATTAVVEQISGQVIARRTVVERMKARGAETIALGYVPVISLGAIRDIYGLQTWDVADFDVEADTGIMTSLLSGPALSGPVEITYVAGYRVIPANLTAAAKIVLRHLWEYQRAGVGGRRTGLGGAVDTVAVAGYAVPRAAAELIGSALPGIA